MRSSLAILLAVPVLVCAPAEAHEEHDEARLIKKIELLGGRVERDETLPNRPVIKISFRHATRFNENYLHLVNGFKHLRSLDLGDLPITQSAIRSIANPQVVVNLLADADEKQFVTAFPAISEMDEAGQRLLRAELEPATFPPEMASSDPAREISSKRQVNSAIALLRMNQAAQVWPILGHSVDNRTRSLLIDRIGPLGVDIRMIVDQLAREPEISIRRALVLSLGGFSPKELDDTFRNGLLVTLKELYQFDADPGLHSAVEWLLTRWSEIEWLKRLQTESTRDFLRTARLKKIQAAIQEKDALPQWYLNSQGQTMIVVPGPVEFTMGSPEKEELRQKDERQHVCRIARTYALAATTVTLDQIRRFNSQHSEGFNDEWVRRGDLPAICVDWYMGARYCNWLSEQEQLEPCYEIHGEEVLLKRNHLSLNGYRFPTEAEIEYATRAGASTSRYFGESEELLAAYAWYQKSAQKRIQPVGLLKPNDFGFFDILGNVFVWCDERYVEYPQADKVSNDVDDNPTAIKVEGRRVLRGGSILSPPSNVRAAYRDDLDPSLRAGYVGFRLARTLLVAESSSGANADTSRN